MGRAAAVELIVSVVIRPNPVTGSFQDLAAREIESKSNQNIEILGSDLLHGIRGKAMDQLFSYRFHVEHFDSGKQTPAVDRGERIVSWLHPCVEAKVKTVKQVLPQFRVRY